MVPGTNPIWLGLEFASEHTKNWRRRDMPIGLLIGRNRVEVLGELEILRKFGI